jgi:hypothetical protein
MGHNWHTLATVSFGLFHCFINVECLNPFDFKVKREVADNIWRFRAARELATAPRFEALRLEDVAPLTFSDFAFCTTVHFLRVCSSCWLE